MSQQILIDLQNAALNTSPTKLDKVSIPVELNGATSNHEVTVINGNKISINGTDYEFAFTAAPQVGGTVGGKVITGDVWSEESKSALVNILSKMKSSNLNLKLDTTGTIFSTNVQIAKPLVMTANGSALTSLSELQAEAGNVQPSQELPPGVGSTGSMTSPTIEDVSLASWGAQTRKLGMFRDSIQDKRNATKGNSVVNAPQLDKITPGKNFNALYWQEEQRNHKKDKNYFKIGDTILSVPPTHLTSTQLRNSYEVDAIGYEAKTISSYFTRPVFKLNLVFEGKDIDTKLKRIITQFRYCPINIIKSNDLFDRIAAPGSWLYRMNYRTSTDDRSTVKCVPIAMEAITLYTIEGHPTSLGCSLQFSIFNYMPYFATIDSEPQLNYYKLELDDASKKNNTKGKTTVPVLKSTTDLEQAVHPYNLVIEDILSDTTRKYMAHEKDSKIQIIKLSTIAANTQLPVGSIPELRTDTVEDVVIGEDVHSMSIHMENNFAWQPIAGYSQPIAQYIGPGADYISINVKTENKNILPQLRKTYNEIVEKEYFGVYDDRYLLRSALTDFAGTPVCSLREVVDSNIDGKPTAIDVNVTFTKTNYSGNKESINNVAKLDEYWGLNRIVKLAKKEQVLAAIEGEVSLAQMVSLNNSILEKISKNSKGADVYSLNVETVDAINQVLDYLYKNTPSGKKLSLPDKSNTAVCFSDVVDQGHVALVATSGHLSRLEKAVLGILDNYFKKNPKAKTDSSTAFILERFGGDLTVESVYGQITMAILTEAGVTGDRQSELLAREILFEMDKFYKTRETGPFISAAITNSRTQRDLSDRCIELFTRYRIQGMWSKTDLEKSYGSTLTLEFDDTITKDQIETIKAAFSASVEAPYRTVYRTAFMRDGYALPELDDSKWPRFGISQDYNTVFGKQRTRLTLVHVQGSNKDEQYSTQAKLKKITAAEKERIKSLNIDPNNEIEELKPWAAHRYFPNIDDFIKRSPMESGSVGKWFACNAIDNLQNKLNKLNKITHDCISPLKDTAAFQTAYTKKHLGGASEIVGNDQYNPMNVLSALTIPVSRKNLDMFNASDKKGATAVGQYTDINPIPNSGFLKSTIQNNVPFSSTSDLLLAPYLFDGATKLTTEVNSFNNAQINIKKDLVNSPSPNKVMPVGVLHPVFHSNKFGQGHIIDGQLKGASAVTVEQTTYGLINDKKSINDPVDREVRNSITFPAQTSILTAQKDPALLAKIIGLGKAVPDYSRSTSSSTPATEDKNADRTEAEKEEIILRAFKEVDAYSKRAGFRGQNISLGDPSDLQMQIIKTMMNLKDGSWATWKKSEKTEELAETLMHDLAEVKAFYDIFTSLASSEESKKSGYQEAYQRITSVGGTILQSKARPQALLKELGNKSNRLSTAERLALIKYVKLNTQELASTRVPDSWRKSDASTSQDLAKVTDTYNTLSKYQATDKDKDKAADFLSQRYMYSLLPTIGLENAFPTYKLYVIQSDTSDYRFFSLDDYYDFRQVQDLMVVRSKDDPVHILRCRIVVDPRYVSTDLFVQEKVNSDRWVPSEHKIGMPTDSNVDTEGENIFNMGKLPLKVGMRLCLKLGYHSDPRALDTVFIGTIVNMNGSMDGYVYEIEAQGDGRELTVQPAVQEQDVKGETYSEVITQIMRMNPNIVHFGKVYGTWLEKFSRKHFLLMGLAKTGYQSAGLFAGGGLASASCLLFGAPVLATTVLASSAVTGAMLFPYGKLPTIGESVLRDYEIAYSGKTSNILSSFKGWFQGAMFNQKQASMQVTKHLFKTFEEGNDPIDDNIFAPNIWNSLVSNKHVSMHINASTRVWDVLSNIKKLYPNYALDVRPYGNRSTIYLGPLSFNYWRTDDPVQAMAPQLNEISNPNITGNEVIQKSLSNLIQRDRFEHIEPTSAGVAPFIPFQKQHVVTSDEDIIMNGIRCTPERGWNAVSISYMKGNGGFDNAPLVQCVADADIEPGSIIRVHKEINWTDDADIANQYATGLLKEGVEKMYGGSLILRGNPRIEPYDKIFIADKVNKMYGWVEAETVIHKFDSQMGFTTHIVPNMVCSINSDAYMTTSQMARQIAWDFISSGEALKFGMTAAAGTVGGAALAAFAAPWAVTILGLVGIGAVGANVYSETQGLFDKYLNTRSDQKPDQIYAIDALRNSLLTSTFFNFSAGGFFLYSLVNMTRRINISDKFKYILKIQKQILADTGGVVSNIKELISIKLDVSKAVATLADAAKQSNNTFKQRIEAALDDPNEMKSLLNEVDEMLAKDGSKTLNKELEGLKQTLEDIAKRQKELKSVGSGVVEATEKLEETYKGMKKISNLKDIGKVAGRATMFYFVSTAIEKLPMLMETIMLKSCSNSSRITIYPVWHRYSLMMAGFDGYNNNDAMMHIKGMILNAKHTLGEAVGNLSLYKVPGFDNIDSNVQRAHDSAVKAKNSAPAVKTNPATRKAFHDKVNNVLKSAVRNGKPLEQYLLETYSISLEVFSNIMTGVASFETGMSYGYTSNKVTDNQTNYTAWQLIETPKQHNWTDFSRQAKNNYSLDANLDINSEVLRTLTAAEFIMHDMNEIIKAGYKSYANYSSPVEVQVAHHFGGGGYKVIKRNYDSNVNPTVYTAMKSAKFDFADTFLKTDPDNANRTITQYIDYVKSKVYAGLADHGRAA